MKDWGPADFQKRASGALREFIDGSRKWLDVQHASGAKAVEQVWSETVAGRVAPSVGHVVSLDEIAA
jgi:hypothetical protein